MRQNEVRQLHKADVMREDGVWFFNVPADDEGRRRKNESSIRKAPVIERGLMRYLAALPDGQLFPGLKPGRGTPS